MNDNQGSFTALITAYSRGYHSMHDSQKIFDDFIAPRMFTEEECTSIEQNLAESLKLFVPERAALCPDQATALSYVMQKCASTPLSRARYTEDSLMDAIKQGVQQYAILGAGLDTFAYRRKDILEQIHVFEIDHPATQASKRERIARAGLEIPPQLHFVSIDFTKENLKTVLNSTPYNSQKLTFFSWLGVTCYLTRDEVFSTLRSVADIAPTGSAIIFDYMDADALDPEKSTMPVQKVQAATSKVGEPIKTGFDPSMLATDLANVGLHLHENLSPSDIEDRYFKGRKDDYHASEHTYFAYAVVK